MIEVFKSGGGETMAKEMGVPFLGRIPMDPQIVGASDEGKPFVYHHRETRVRPGLHPGDPARFAVAGAKQTSRQAGLPRCLNLSRRKK